MVGFVPTIGKSWAKHNQLFEKDNGRFEKDNEQFEKINRLLGHEQPSLRRKTVSHGPKDGFSFQIARYLFQIGRYVFQKVGYVLPNSSQWSVRT